MQRRKEMSWNGVIENCPLNTSRVLHNLREFVLKYLPNSGELFSVKIDFSFFNIIRLSKINEIFLAVS